MDAWFESAATKGLATPVAMHTKLQVTNGVAKSAAREVNAEKSGGKGAFGSAIKRDTLRSPLGVRNDATNAVGGTLSKNDATASIAASARRRAAECLARDSLQLEETKSVTAEKVSAEKSVLKSASKSTQKTPSTRSKDKAASAILPALTPVRASPRRAAAAVAAKAIDAAAPSEHLVSKVSPATRASPSTQPKASPMRSSPRLRAAALTAANEASVVSSEQLVSGVSAKRAPAFGAATKTPSRLRQGTTANVSFEDTVGLYKVKTDEKAQTPDEAAATVPAAVPDTDANNDSFAFPVRRKGLTGGGAVRVLVVPNAAAIDEPADSDHSLGNDSPSQADLTPSSHKTPMMSTRSMRSGGKSSVKSSFPVSSLLMGEDSKHSVVSSGDLRPEPSTRSAGANSECANVRRSRRVKQAPPVKELTVPVSPAITRGGTKRTRDNGMTTEEILLEQSLRAAAEEKSKRRKVNGGRADTKPRNVSTAATSRKKTAVVAFGGRVGGGAKATRSKGKGNAYAQLKPVTVPTSPNLSRPDRFFKEKAKTTEELELEKIAQVPKFKARRLRGTVLRGVGDAAEKAHAASNQRREMTLNAYSKKPTPFDAVVGRKRKSELLVDLEEQKQRDLKRTQAMQEAEQAGFGTCSAVPLTLAESPKFQTARRAVLRAPYEDAIGGAQGVSGVSTRGGARRVVAASDVDAEYVNRHASSPGRVDGITHPAPFRLQTDRRGEASRADLERHERERQKHELEKMKGAKAKPVPKTSSSRRRSKLPEPHFKPPTVIEPFYLKGEALHAYEERQKALRIEEEERVAEETMNGFKAQRVPNFRSVFTVAPSAKPLTAPVEEVGGAGERRAAERAAFDAEVAEQLRIREEEEAEQERLASIEKAKETKKLRKSLQFKAAPMPDYGRLASLGVAPIPERRLTRPESPSLATNRRASRWG